jgi:hypothetical protein
VYEGLDGDVTKNFKLHSFNVTVERLPKGLVKVDVDLEVDKDGILTASVAKHNSADSYGRVDGTSCVVNKVFAQTSMASVNHFVGQATVSTAEVGLNCCPAELTACRFVCKLAQAVRCSISTAEGT